MRTVSFSVVPTSMARARVAHRLHLLLAQPLAGSWQDRVKAAKKAEKRAAKKAAKAAADSGVDVVALSKGLPTGWQAMLDAASGDVYYGNLSTKVGVGACWCTTTQQHEALRHAQGQ